MPERIWAAETIHFVGDYGEYNDYRQEWASAPISGEDCTEYVRADSARSEDSVGSMSTHMKLVESLYKTGKLPSEDDEQ